MNLKIIIIVIIALIITSCATYQRQPMTSTHRYELLVKDVNGIPIEGAEVDYIVEVEWKEHSRGKLITKSDGKAIMQVSHTDYPLLNAVEFTSTLKYKISKKGYYTVSGSKSILYDSDRSVTESIILLRPIDFIKPKFLSSQEGIALKANILRFIDLILLQSLLANVNLEPQSIDLIQFKGRRYLQFTFTSNVVYNSLRLNKYDIGKRVFDDVIRKILSPLNKYISDPRLFYGYDLKVIGYTKDFTNKFALPQPIEYRFMIPQSIVQKYKNKDISGQQLLDASIILMDDERIELKLQ